MTRITSQVAEKLMGLLIFFWEVIKELDEVDLLVCQYTGQILACQYKSVISLLIICF